METPVPGTKVHPRITYRCPIVRMFQPRSLLIKVCVFIQCSQIVLEFSSTIVPRITIVFSGRFCATSTDKSTAVRSPILYWHSLYLCRLYCCLSVLYCRCLYKRARMCCRDTDLCLCVGGVSVPKGMRCRLLLTPSVTNSPHIMWRHIITLVDAAFYRRRPPLVGGIILRSLAIVLARPRLRPTPGGWS